MSASSIMVTVRVRPFSIREAAQLTKVDDSPTFFGDGSLANTPVPKITGKGIRRVVKVMDDKMLVFDPPEENPLTRFQRTLVPQGKKVKDMKFGFDRVFDENATQEDVYETTTRGLLGNILDGFNATVFAYGATGCGKTHTISGNPTNPGIIHLTMQELYTRIEELRETKEVDLTMSYLEIYNETIRDLLIEGGSTKKLDLREDSNQAISVAGLTLARPQNADDVKHLIAMGNANRTMSPTEANATSSRSHAVLQINVSQKERGSALSDNHISATLSIIDLAGSERASVTKNRGDRLLEGANINRSLLALGNCINALCDPSRRNHVPYRDSKLTRLLKFSLGGNCKTVMIVCVSPTSQHYDETHNTLKYANRAKNIKTKVSRNLINVNRHVSQYVKHIYDLTQEVEELKRRLADTTKEAMDKISKQSNHRELALKEGSRKLKIAFENSQQLRNTRIQDYKNLRLIERRISLVHTWIAAFDGVFANQVLETPPEHLFTIRNEAEKVLQDLENSQFGLTHRLAGPSPEKDIDRALEVAMKNIKAIETHSELDLISINHEANLYKTIVERELFHSLAEADVDATSSVLTLSKALFQTVHTLNQVNMQEEFAKMLFDIVKLCTDATSHIIKPNGELVSSQDYPNISFESPRKKKQQVSIMNLEHIAASPIRGPFASTNGVNGINGVNGVSSASELPRPSPRAFKVGTPKKAVQFKKKSPRKKRVRFQMDETETEDMVEEDPKRSRVETLMTTEPPNSLFVTTTSQPPASGPNYRPLPPILRASSEPPVKSITFENDFLPLEIAPVRPRSSRMQVGFLSKSLENPDFSFSAESSFSSISASSSHSHKIEAKRAFSSPLSPLKEFDITSPELNKQSPHFARHNPENRKQQDYSSADELSSHKPWQVNLAPPPTKSAMKSSRRVSSGGAFPYRSHGLRRRVPSNESSSGKWNGASPENGFKTGAAARRLLKSEKENTGHGGNSGFNVLSPKATALKSAPRRITLSGPGASRRMSSAVVLERAAMLKGRESTWVTGSEGAKKVPWR